MLQSYKTVSCHNVSNHLDSFGLFGRSDEYGEGPKGPASTGEEAEMGFEALKVLDKSRSVIYRYSTHTAWYATSSLSSITIRIHAISQTGVQFCFMFCGSCRSCRCSVGAN